MSAPATDHLAVAMIRVFLADMVLCHEDFEHRDVQFWATLLQSDEGEQGVCHEVLAYRDAKRRLKGSRSGNPQNVLAVLLYNISHSAPLDASVQAAWEDKLTAGFSIREISRPDQAMDLIEELVGSCLSQRQIGKLVGRAVNLRRVAEVIREEYDRLLSGGKDER